eukprot:gene15073-28112_t
MAPRCVDLSVAPPARASPHRRAAPARGRIASSLLAPTPPRPAEVSPRVITRAPALT